MAAAAGVKAAEEAKYAESESKYDAGRWSNAQGGWDTSQWDSTSYDRGLRQEHYDQSQYASQYDDGTQYTYDEGTQRESVRRWRPVQLRALRPVRLRAVYEEDQCGRLRPRNDLHRARRRERARSAAAQRPFIVPRADPSEICWEEPTQLEASTERVSTYSEEPQQGS